MGPGGSRRGPNAKIMAAIQPIPLGAPIRLTKNTRASRSTPRMIPISVGSKYTTTRNTKAKIQNTKLFAKSCMSPFSPIYLHQALRRNRVASPPPPLTVMSAPLPCPCLAWPVSREDPTEPDR